MAHAIVAHEHGFTGRTPRAETFQEIIGNLVRPARIRADRRGRYDFQLNHVRFERLEVTVLSYGDPVEVDLREIGGGARDTLVLQLMLAGSSCTHVDGADPVQQYRSSAHLSTCDMPMRVTCHRGCRHFLIRMDRATLLQTADDLQQSIELPDPRRLLSLSSPAGKALRRYMRYLVTELDLGGGEFLRFASRATEQSLLAHVLAALRSSGTPAEDAPHATQRPVCVPLYIRRAEAFMEEHLDQDIGVQDIVASSGASLRTLYRGFEQARGTTPMGFLRELRLERAHAQLAESSPSSIRVTDVALRWGFGHLSEFAARYRERFGCLPSQTLRRK